MVSPRGDIVTEQHDSKDNHTYCNNKYMHKYKHSHDNKSHIDDIMKCHIMNKILDIVKMSTH